MDRGKFLEVMDRWMLAYCPCGDSLVPGLNDDDVASLNIPILVFRSGVSDMSHTRATSEALAVSLPGAELVEPPWDDDEWNERRAAVEQVGSLFVRWPLLVPQLVEWADKMIGDGRPRERLRLKTGEDHDDDDGAACPRGFLVRCSDQRCHL